MSACALRALCHATAGSAGASSSCATACEAWRRAMSPRPSFASLHTPIVVRQSGKGAAFSVFRSVSSRAKRSNDMKKRIHLSLAVVMAALGAGAAQAANDYLIRIDGIAGTSTVAGFEDYINVEMLGTFYPKII